MPVIVAIDASSLVPEISCCFVISNGEAFDLSQEVPPFGLKSGDVGLKVDVVTVQLVFLVSQVVELTVDLSQSLIRLGLFLTDIIILSDLIVEVGVHVVSLDSDSLLLGCDLVEVSLHVRGVDLCLLHPVTKVKVRHLDALQIVLHNVVLGVNIVFVVHQLVHSLNVALGHVDLAVDVFVLSLDSLHF